MWNGVDTQLLGIKIAQCRNLPLRADEVASAEFFTRNGTQLPSDHPFGCFVISVDDDLIDLGLRPFHYPDINVDGISYNFNFSRHYIKEQVSVIHVDGANILPGRIKKEALLKQGLVIYLTSSYVQNFT